MQKALLKAEHRGIRQLPHTSPHLPRGPAGSVFDVLCYIQKIKAFTKKQKKHGFLMVLNLRVLAPLSMLAFIIRAWLVSEWISKSSEFAGVGCCLGLACIIMDF